VQRLGVDMRPEELASASKFTDLEVTQTGDVVTLDSIDLVEVIEVLEDTFEVELLEDEGFREEFQEKGFTIQNMGEFLVQRFGLEPGWVGALAESKK
jgi:acyl carrier protein